MVILDAQEKLSSVLLAPHMSHVPWSTSAFKVALANLLVTLERTHAHLEKQAAAAAKRTGTAKKLGLAAFTQSNTDSHYVSIAAVPHVTERYVPLDAAIRAQHYSDPLPCETFEPIARGSRYAYYRDLRLSVPVWLLNFHVGHTIGTLHWIVSLDTDLDESGRMTELEAIRGRLQQQLPAMHARVLKRMYFQKLSGITGLTKSLANFTYRLLTGDESVECDSAQKQRDAHTTAALFNDCVDDTDIVFDLRAHSNSLRKGKSCFASFWDVVHEVRV